MKIGYRIALLLVFACTAAGFGYWFLQPKRISVIVTPVQTGVIEMTVVNTRSGTVKACRRAQLSPAIGGQIATMPVGEGMSVKKNEVLLTLWNNDLQAQLELVESEAEATEVQAKAVCLQAGKAARQAARYVALNKSGGTTEETLDTVLTDKEIREVECTAAKKNVTLSRNRVKVAQANLDRTLLSAPFDGIIAALNGELGEYITPSPVGVQTLPTVDLIDTSCFYVSAPIDEVDVARIKKGMVANITLDAFRNRVFPARVRRISNYVLDLEKQARTVEIEVEFADPMEAAQLLPGYSADAEVIIEVKRDVLRVPTEAIIEQDTVFVYQAPAGKVFRHKVTTGVANWDYTEIVSGLEAGELVVVTIDNPDLKDGVLARVEEAGEKQ